jgi:hypothetical protein
MTNPELLQALRLVRDPNVLLECLNALIANFDPVDRIGDALLDCILITDDYLNNEPKNV